MQKIAPLAAMILALSAMASGGPSRADGAKSRICKPSSGRFSTLCPRGWNLLAVGPSSLDLLSFPLSEREEGVVIKPGGAEIIISQSVASGKAFERWVEYDNRTIESKNITYRSMTYSLITRCRKAISAEYMVDEGSPPPERDLTFYCDLGASVIKLQLRFWKGDPKESAYRASLDNMWRELRVYR